MRNIGYRTAIVLVFGDIIAYLFSLVLTLTVRYSAVPSYELLSSHLSSFAILFALFVLIGFSAGFYDKKFFFAWNRVHSLLLRVQFVNILLGAAFFYFAPVSITPKANLFIYFIISTILLWMWRTGVFPVISTAKAENAIIIGNRDGIEDLLQEINNNGHYGLIFKEKIIPNSDKDILIEKIRQALNVYKANIVVVDMHDNNISGITNFLYSQIFSGIQIVDASRLYESIFDRIPVLMVGERWLAENIGSVFGGRKLYDLAKRLEDIVIAGIVGIVSLLVYPFVYIAIKIEDGGKIFIEQERIGKGGKLIKIIKFRSMSSNDNGKYNVDGKSDLTITKVGRLLRMTRIDELPQLWSVLMGDQSLTGPRPELPAIAKVYEKEIPFYNVRHLVKPGLSGWAQIYHEAHPHHAVAIEDAKDKLSYDLYYVKNRSLGLDMRIILQTVRAILSKQGI